MHRVVIQSDRTALNQQLSPTYSCRCTLRLQNASHSAFMSGKPNTSTGTSSSHSGRHTALIRSSADPEYQSIELDVNDRGEENHSITFFWQSIATHFCEADWMSPVTQIAFPSHLYPSMYAQKENRHVPLGSMCVRIAFESCTYAHEKLLITDYDATVIIFYSPPYQMLAGYVGLFSVDLTCSVAAVSQSVLHHELTTTKHNNNNNSSTSSSKKSNHRDALTLIHP